MFALSTRRTRAAVDRGLVLHALPGTGPATADALAAVVDRPLRQVRRALRVLHQLSMVRQTEDGTAWEVTRRGREFVDQAQRAAV